MSAPTSVPISHRSVLAIAIPVMLSNVSEPLIGVVNTAVIGQLPDPYYTGAIAVGALIFSFISPGDLAHSVWGLVAGTLCAAVIWFGAPWFIDLMTVNEEVREVARRYAG